MKLNYVGKNVQIRDYFKEEADKKFGRLDKYFDQDVEGTVTLSVNGNFKTIEVTVYLPDQILRAEETSDEVLTAVDSAVDALVSQIRKYKTKLKKRHTNGRSIRFEHIPEMEDAIEEDDSPNIARVKEIGIKPMSVEEAILQMELLGHDFFVFWDAQTDETHVVYKRKKGDYGLIVPTRN